MSENNQLADTVILKKSRNIFKEIQEIDNLKDLTEIEKIELKKQIDVGLYKNYSNMDFEKFALKSHFNEYDYHSDADTSSGGE
jgi:hypothetical protein